MNFLFLFVLWIILNGKVTVEIAALGFIISLGLHLFSRSFIGYGCKFSQISLRCVLKGVAYLFLLIAEIVKANLNTAKMILTFEQEPEPLLVRFKSRLGTETGQVILANSITLTPGTLTIDLTDGEFLIHSLDKSFAEGIERSVFIDKIEMMEKISVKEAAYGS